MKGKINHLIIIFSIIFSACDSQPETEGSFLNLSEKQISIGHFGGTREVLVESNMDWDILNSSVPEWCCVEKTHDSGQYYMEIIISPNRTFQTREATVTIQSDGYSTYLSISQTGIKNELLLDWHTFPVNSISDVKFEFGNDGVERKYQILYNEIFINPIIKEKIYHGNLINNKATLESGLIEYKQYTYNPITISSFVDGFFYSRESIVPSIENTDDLYREIKANYPNQNLHFTFQNTPIQYYSYRHLNLLGIGNLGLKLDEIINDGKSYQKEELGDRTGLLYSYCNILFNVTMDIPGELIQETISDDEAHKISYVSNIKYGKMAFLIIETDYDYNISKIVVEKIMKGSQLSEQEEKIKNSINANYLTFEEDGNLAITKGIEVIRAYVSDIYNQPIIPLSFSVNRYDNNSIGHFENQFKVP